MTDRLPIVDDEEPIRYALRDYFLAVGYEVDCAASFDEAIIALDAFPYAGVIADLRLKPGEWGGLEVVQSVRARSTQCSILVLSAYGSPDAVSEALQRDLGLRGWYPSRRLAAHLRALLFTPPRRNRPRALHRPTHRRGAPGLRVGRERAGGGRGLVIRLPVNASAASVDVLEPMP